MTIIKLLRNTLVLLIFMTLPAFSYDLDESNTFIEGLAEYQRGTYPTAITKLENWIKEYPDSLVLDLGLYWLAQSYYHNGNQREAARYTSLLFSVYPDSPLTAIIGNDLKDLAKRYFSRLLFSE